MLVVCVLTVITLSCLFVRVCCCCVMKKVQLDESIGDKSVTPESMISDSNGPETRLQSKISELKLKNLSLQEEC